MRRTVVLASGNLGKLREINDLLKGTGIEVSSQSRFGIPAAEETGATFLENAILKARHAARHAGHPAIADDSGIEVDALGGAPGVHSARYAGVSASDSENLQKLLAALHDVPSDKRTARFQCVMVYVRDARDPSPIVARGTWSGRIAFAPRGDNGFGYDPVFLVPGRGCTSAELAPEEKNRLSHRSQALRALIEGLRANGIL